MVAVLICQVKLVKSFLQETLGLGSFGVITVLITLTILFLLINLYKYIQVKYVEEKIGFFTNPCNIGDIDKGKMLTTKYGAKFHVLEESDFYLALDAQIKKSYMSQFLFVGQKEVLLHMVVDAIVTDLLNKQIISASCVYNGNRTFKMNDDDARLDEGVL